MAGTAEVSQLFTVSTPKGVGRNSVNSIHTMLTSGLRTFLPPCPKLFGSVGMVHTRSKNVLTKIWMPILFNRRVTAEGSGAVTKKLSHGTQ